MEENGHSWRWKIEIEEVIEIFVRKYGDDLELDI